MARQKRTQAEEVISSLASIIKAKFFYNSITKITSEGIRPIWRDMCDRHKQGEFDNLNEDHLLNYLSRQTLPCTPIQGYLFAFNLGY